MTGSLNDFWEVLRSVWWWIFRLLTGRCLVSSTRLREEIQTQGEQGGRTTSVKEEYHHVRVEGRYLVEEIRFEPGLFGLGWGIFGVWPQEQNKVLVEAIWRLMGYWKGEKQWIIFVRLIATGKKRFELEDWFSVWFGASLGEVCLL